MSLNGNTDETNGYNSVIKNGERSNVDLIKAVIAPIGAIMPWLKTFTNTPTLPDGWAECDGSTVSDSDSPYNGQTLPDMNGNNYFLRGASTSGGTGGSATHNHQWHDKSGAGGVANKTYDSSGAEINIVGAASTGEGLDCINATERWDTDSYTTKVNGEPPYYETVFIMRIK